MTNRKCGDCTLCCKLMPVASLRKPANTKCRHQTRNGCKVYHDLAAISPSCHLWRCRWLTGDQTQELRRPDRAHYVIDMVPDFAGIRNDSTGETTTVQVIQVWADPDYPDAWKHDEALMRYIDEVAKDNTLVMVRFDSVRSVCVLPPRLVTDGQWHFKETTLPGDSGWTNPLDSVRGDERDYFLKDGLLAGLMTTAASSAE